MMLVTLLAGLSLTGCSGGDFERRDLGPTSKQAHEIAGMLAQLRDTTRENARTLVDQQIVPEMPRPNRERLAKSIVDVAQAESIELASLDCFGDKVYRLGLTQTGAQSKSRRVCLTLVKDKDNNFYWAEIN